MADCIGGIIFIAILAFILLGLPGIAIWLHFRLRKSLDAEAGFFSMLLGALLVLYGLVVGYAYCDFRWNGFAPLNDAMPRFSLGGSPRITDYWQEAWPLYLWCFVGLVVLGQGCLRCWRDYFDRSVPMRRSHLYIGALMFMLGGAVSGIGSWEAYRDHAAFEVRTQSLFGSLQYTLQQLDRVQKGNTQAATHEVEGGLFNLAFEIDDRSKGRPLMSEERYVLQGIEGYWQAHPEGLKLSQPDNVRRLQRILQRAEEQP